MRESGWHWTGFDVGDGHDDGEDVDHPVLGVGEVRDLAEGAEFEGDGGVGG